MLATLVFQFAWRRLEGSTPYSLGVSLKFPLSLRRNSSESNLCSATNSRRILGPAGRTDSFVSLGQPIGHRMMSHNWKAVTLPSLHSAGDDNHIVQTLPFEVTGLELGERAALGNEIKRFVLEQFARAHKCFG
jgi:hypothetical protein